VAGVAPRSRGDRPAPRRTLAFSLSLLLHLALALLILAAIERHIASPPLEVSIVEGQAGPGSAPSGAARGPPAAAPREVQPADATRAPSVPRAKVVRRPRSQSKPPAPPVTDEAPSLAIREPRPAPVARASEGASSGGTALETRAAGVEAGGETNSGGAAGRGGFSVSGGGRSYASIWQGTQRYLAGLRWAYDNELRTHAGLRGVIVVRYEILSDGAVGDVAMVSSELQAPRLEQQVLSQIRDWRYLPEATGTVVVTWPFAFRPPR
jgi:TonB family protein